MQVQEEVKVFTTLTPLKPDPKNSITSVGPDWREINSMLQCFFQEQATAIAEGSI